MTEAARVSSPVMQAGHGFRRATAVRFDGTDWVRGLAGEAGLGLVGSVMDPDTFEFVQLGELDGLDDFQIDGTNFAPGTQYFVSAAVAGELTATPTASPILRAYTARTGYVALSSTAAGTTMVFSGVTPAQLAEAMAAEIVRTEATYAKPGEDDDSMYLDFTRWVVDVDNGGFWIDVDNLVPLYNVDED